MSQRVDLCPTSGFLYVGFLYPGGLVDVPAQFGACVSEVCRTSSCYMVMSHRVGDSNQFGFVFACWDAGGMHVGVVLVMKAYVFSWVGCLVSQRVGGAELLWLTLCIPVGVPEGWWILICLSFCMCCLSKLLIGVGTFCALPNVQTMDLRNDADSLFALDIPSHDNGEVGDVVQPDVDGAFLAATGNYVKCTLGSQDAFGCTALTLPVGHPAHGKRFVWCVMDCFLQS